MKKWFKLFRVKHYMKNLLVLCPLFFWGRYGDTNVLIRGIAGTIFFCILSSTIYIINDLMDIDEDKCHPIKKERPLAAGTISKRTAIICLIILFVILISANVAFTSLWGYNIGVLWLLVYFILNVFYSFGLKNVPIVDLVILASGFLIRVLYGGAIMGIPISSWLYLTVISFAFYLGLGKRRNEIKKMGIQNQNQGSKADTREVLKHYPYDFLDRMMYLFLTLGLMFYSLWAISWGKGMNVESRMIWTIPLTMIIFMKYTYVVENDGFGDPVDVLTSDKVLMMLVLIWGCIMGFALYC